MIIRGVEAQNWRCIGRVAIHDLPLGVIVLHGPNRTGKSSLFEAIRYCLYDYDHDSTARSLAAVVPRTTKAAPKVVVDFEVAQVRYRITKVFSKGKEGTACLERRTDDRWVMDVREPKEASRKARELLGAEKAEAGLNQLLWLEQGQVKLPEARRLDASLTKRLEMVLGALVTAQDVDFRRKLHERCERWFTKKMQPKRGSRSRLAQLEQQKQDCEASLDQTLQELDKADDLVREFGITEDRIRREHGEIHQAKQAVVAVEQEKAASRERREGHRQASQALEAARKDLQRAQNARQQCAEIQRDLDVAEEALREAEREFQTAKKKAEAAAAEHGQAQQAARQARNAAEEHAQTRAELDDRQQLLQVQEALGELGRGLGQVEQYQRDIRQRESDLSGPPAPTEKQLGELRKMENEIRSARVQLQAGGIYLRIEAEKELTGQIKADREPPQAVQIAPEALEEWSARQRIRAEISGLGMIQVGRSREDADLEHSAARLKELERKYRESLATWQQDPDAAEALDNLNERRIRREGWTKDLQALKSKLQALAPEGAAALESEKQRLVSAREAVLQRRSQLTQWEPDEHDLNERRAEFERRAQALAALGRDAEQRAANLANAARNLESQCNDLRNELTAKRVARDEKRKQLDALPSAKALEEGVAHATQAVEQADRRVQDTALTEAEQTIEERLATARTALAKREDRLRKAEVRLAEYRGELRKTEGLHAKRVAGEQQLHALQHQLDREQLEANAHALLCQLFDDCRDVQVRGTMEPIAARVLEWAEHLDLTEYEGVAFQTDFLPQGLLRRGHGPDEEPVAFDEESYGTEEQLALLVRLALGGLLASDEPQVAILDDPLAHSDPEKHQRMLDILKWASEGKPSAQSETKPPGKLQTFILTCHPDRFDYLPGATQIDFVEAARQSSERA